MAEKNPVTLTSNQKWGWGQEGHSPFHPSATVRLCIAFGVGLSGFCALHFAVTDFVAAFEKQNLKVREIRKQRLNTFTLYCSFGRRVPSTLQYFGYMFHHSMLLAGPTCTFNDYIDFIEGRDIARATEQVSGMSL